MRGENMETVKQIAQKTIEKLPKDSTWEDVFYKLYVVKKIEEGLVAEESGKVKPHDEVVEIFSR
jgi:predicted transcriptional regulator